jgi:hypothetical protein
MGVAFEAVVAELASATNLCPKLVAILLSHHEASRSSFSQGPQVRTIRTGAIYEGDSAIQSMMSQK